LKLRTTLFAGVSTLALTVGAAELRAADVPPPAPRAVLKAPPPVVQPGVLTLWIEGGAFWTGGSDVRLGIPDVVSNVAGLGGFGIFRPRAGLEAAVGADWRFAASPWHVSFDVRYGQAKSRGQNFAKNFTTHTGDNASSIAVAVQGQARQHESHLVADFMVGRDIGVGGILALSQVKFGVRVADLESRLHADLQAFAKCTDGGVSCGLGNNSTAAAAVSLDERSRFLGVGPRGAIEGAVPLGGPWAVDYMGGIAVLFGEQKLKISGAGVSSSSFFGTTGTFTFATQSTSNKAVFNADASAALSYWFTPHAKISAGFRFDGYWKALRTFDANGNIVNVDRFYYGPFVRLTGQF